MAETDLSKFLATLTEAEAEMDDLFTKLARDVGNLVLMTAGPDGTVPPARLPALRQQMAYLVDAVFLAGPDRRPFSVVGNLPLAPYPAIVSKGQLAMIDRALTRTERIVDRHLPADVRQRLRMRQVKR